MATVLGATAVPAAASTTTAQKMADRVVYLLNRDRKARGLAPLRRWGPVNRVATERAGNMAGSNTLSHDAAGGDVGNILTNAGIQWFGFGEIIGSTNATWGRQSANYIYKLWKASSYHRSVMFSRSYNYIGVGFARRSKNGTTWASIVFTDSRDHTRPVAKNGSLARSGTTITFRWAGHDRRLQRRTAGLKSFDVQMRRDNGTWRTIRDNTTATKLTLRHRKHGHYFWFRVQSQDRRGNLSKWTKPVRVWVP
jgi:Cysteine-rich secretory protein family